ncbi:MAG: hypothetical protein IT376_16060 [Polyangiaceae bacterium]|nr:hypothetical protein [Polyangiaceae bacterium]
MSASGRRALGATRALATLLIAGALGAGCGATDARAPGPAIAELRRDGAATKDAELAGRWLLGELVSPGGDAKEAGRARARLDSLGGGGVLAALARAHDDVSHGRLDTAPDHFLEAARAARRSASPDAPLFAWLAVREGVGREHDAPGLWDRWRSWVDEARREPGNLGWRARAVLVDWAARRAHRDARAGAIDEAARDYGCVDALRIAGPFGRGVAADAVRSFPAEAPGPWPHLFPRDPMRGQAPRVLGTRRAGCIFRPAAAWESGVYYAETYLELPERRELVLVAPGALGVLVDDHLVLDRDPRRFGSDVAVGVRVWLAPGRHRVLARLGDARASLRVLEADGRPARVVASSDPAGGYALEAPEVTSPPDVLSRWVHGGQVRDPGDDVLRWAAARLAQGDGASDVASVLLEPLVKDPTRAAGTTLELASAIVQRDPIFESGQARDLASELQRRAIAKDDHLPGSHLALALFEAEKSGLPEGVRAVRALAGRFPKVPAFLATLARLEGELGWTAEHAETTLALIDRFPEHLEALHAAVELLDARGEATRADELVARILALDPDSEILVDRAIARADWEAAITELRRLAARRPEREAAFERLEQLLEQAGRSDGIAKRLERLLEREPRNARARLALADLRHAGGDRGAIRRAVALSLEAGAPTSDLEEALDLVEGMNELEPYRLPAREVIRAHEASGLHMPGTAARVLDYAAVWVRADGSSRMLEHEILRIQSAEAVGKYAEHPRLEGHVFALRVIKKDGRVLEPEYVAGKPTVTLPHLEVGDYIETERVVSFSGDSQGGLAYLGPWWYFREENVAYARSELVVVSPRSRPLEIETRGAVPAPSVEEKGEIVVRRWRVDASPAAPSEPGSAPASEFLPSVRLGWGVRLENRLRVLAEAAVDLTPVDPRIRRVAARIAAPGKSASARARLLYRWILDNVEEGDEEDGRRVVIGKSGKRARGFRTLCSALGLEVDWVVARNRLVAPPVGELSRATQYGEALFRLRGERGPIFLTVGDKFAAFGWVPAEVRGAPGFALRDGVAVPLEVPAGGIPDALEYDVDVTLSAEGAARVVLTQSFSGKLAMGLRNGLSQLPEGQVGDVLESRLLGRSLRGARLTRHEILHLDDLDRPLVIRMYAEVASFARPEGGGLVFAPPFVPRLSQLATLPERQTPLLLTDSTEQRVVVRVTLPPGARARVAARRELAHGGMKVVVADRLEGGRLVLDRSVRLAAGRIQPGEYEGFLEFTRAADAALEALVHVGGGG